MHIDELKDNIKREMSALRADLRDLKRCQLQYFTLSLTGTGAILGLAAILGNDFKGLALLAPLAIILPNWAIFFDKATTITRIVGYQRILEKQACADKPIYKYLGYENALAKFRKHEKEVWAVVREEMKSRRARYRDVFLLQTRHRFWMINWYTFAILSLICCVGAYTVLGNNDVTLSLPFGIQLTAPERTMWAGSSFVILGICATYTLLLILELTRGGLSYEACTRKWQHILELGKPMPNDIT